jgi:hypothetical protein
VADPTLRSPLDGDLDACEGIHGKGGGVRDAVRGSLVVGYVLPGQTLKNGMKEYLFTGSRAFDKAILLRNVRVLVFSDEFPQTVGLIPPPKLAGLARALDKGKPARGRR